MISAINSALSGILTASKQVEGAASNIANNTSSDTSGSNVIEDIVDIKVAETAFKANIQTLKVADDMSQEFLKIFDERV